MKKSKKSCYNCQLYNICRVRALIGEGLDIGSRNGILDSSTAISTGKRNAVYELIAEICNVYKLNKG